MDLSQYVVAPGAGNETAVIGSLCCFVCSRADSATRFALGCHHVLARGSENGCKAVPETILRVQPTGELIGKLHSCGTLYPNRNRYSMDVAITKIATTAPAENRFAQTRIRKTLLPNDMPSSGRFTLCTPRRPGAGIPAEFVGAFYARELDYTCGSVLFESLFKFRSNTEDGDSGSAIVADNGTLIGMHIFGSHVTGTSEYYSYAIPAYDLFRDDLFSVEIDLI